MESEPIKIYLSSTYEDLKDHRRTVFNALRQSGYQVIAMEDYVAQDARPVNACLDEVADSDIYVGIFGLRYGYMPPPDHDNPDGLSITELEFRQADSQDTTYCLTFLLDMNHGLPPQNFVDAFSDENEHGERIKCLRAHLQKEKTASFFDYSKPHELAIQVHLVEADEIFIGGKQTLAERRKSGNSKTPFFMAVQENDHGGPEFVTFEEIEGVYETQILPAIEKHIKKGSKIISDGEGSYVKSKEQGYDHDRYIESQDPEMAHEKLKWINTLTSNLKRFLLSTHHGVYPKYRKKYLAEFAYRFNRRYWPEQIFDRLLYACIHADPVTLRELKA